MFCGKAPRVLGLLGAENKAFGALGHILSLGAPLGVPRGRRLAFSPTATPSTLGPASGRRLTQVVTNRWYCCLFTLLGFLLYACFDLIIGVS